MKTDLIDLCEELGWDERRIPVRMREPTMHGMGYCSSLAALYATVDPRPGGETVDIRSGGVIGWRRIAEALGAGCQRLPYLSPSANKWLLSVVASHVQNLPLRRWGRSPTPRSSSMSR